MAVAGARWQGRFFLVDVVGWMPVERCSTKTLLKTEVGNKGGYLVSFIEGVF